MTAYFLGAINVDDTDTYDRYRQGAAAAFAEFGIEILAIGGTVLEGVKPAEHLFIARAMSMERLQAFYASPAYQSVIGYRHASADTHFLIAMPGPGESEWNDKSEEGDST